MTLKPSGELKENGGLQICPKGKTLDGPVIEDKFTKDESASFLLVFLKLICCTHRRAENICPTLNLT